LTPAMPEHEWKIPLNFDALPVKLEKYFGMTVE
jgi:hypothetical protein